MEMLDVWRSSEGRWSMVSKKVDWAFKRKGKKVMERRRLAVIPWQLNLENLQIRRTGNVSDTSRPQSLPRRNTKRQSDS